MSESVVFPEWDESGILPPVVPGAEMESSGRSPYTISFSLLCERFCTSRARHRLLSGLCSFRESLYEHAIVSGFQWIDGSFVEDVERINGRDPADIDLVSFLDLQTVDQAAIVQKHPGLFDQREIRELYSLDHFILELGEPSDRAFVGRVAYWYSVWSHRRDNRWKGFIQLPLNPEGDRDARLVLNAWKEEQND